MRSKTEKGAAREEADRLNEERASLRRQLDQQPQNVHILNLLGECEMRANALKSAIQLFSQAIELDSTNFQSWYGLGLALEASGKRKDAGDAFRKSLEYNPRFNLAAQKLEDYEEDKTTKSLREDKILRPHERIATVIYTLTEDGQEKQHDILFFTTERLIWGVHKHSTGWFKSAYGYKDLSYDAIRKVEKRGYPRVGWVLVGVCSTRGDFEFQFPTDRVGIALHTLRRIARLA